MEDPHFLVNDESIEDVEDTRSITEDRLQDLNELGILLSSGKDKAYSTNKVLKGSLTLRECNLQYRLSNGCKATNTEPAEFDRCQTKGCISPLRKFNNAIGHFIQSLPGSNVLGYSILCLKLELCNNIIEFKDSLSVGLQPSIHKKYLWNIQNCSLCFKTETGKWMFNNQVVESAVATSLDILSVSFPPPLSAHTHHAWLESKDNKDIIGTLNIFKQPEETTAVTGILGTLQNNQLIDLAQEQDNEPVNIAAREEDLDVPGFLCSGHTAHSMEAGRVRRICHGVSVRVLSKLMLDKLFRVLEVSNRYNSESKQWILFCMGKFVYCSTKCLVFIRNQLVSLSSSDINTCTLHINKQMHTAILSISSGVLLRRDINNLTISTTSIYSDIWPDNKYTPTFPNLATNEGFRFHFSGFFQLTPYIAFDRPPRTLISSVQSIQAVTAPYGAGTSSVAPTHISKPLVSTPLIEELLHDTINGSDCRLADMVPGEDLVVCFANFNDTNEDSIMMSESSSARGLFSHMAYSVHVVKDSETIPPIGEYANIEDNRWWKCYSRRVNYKAKMTTSESITIPQNCRHIIAGGDGKGKVISTNLTQTGEVSVKVLRYSTPVTGDKLASGHGQKGVIKLIPEIDMPWGVDDNGEPIKFDIVISLSSISNRLTNGQYYEMVSGVNAAGQGKRIIVSPSTSHNMHTETVLYDGKTGNIIERYSDTGDNPIQASWGINRVWQMTQLTWDKQHYTHNTAGKYAITTGVGRTAGGGIRFGEMESHAVESSGLLEPYRELRSRMDLIDVQICMKCETLVQMCTCGTSESFVQTSIPHSAMVFDYSNILTSGFITKYKLSF